MDSLKRHEVFEIEVLERLKNAGFLRPLVFSGGTMLRLCYDLRRYSTDLDFWFLKKVNQRQYYFRLRDYLAKHYKLTDSQPKFYTLLFELGSPRSPKRLKIEIRRKIEKRDYEDKIAFSPYATSQVILKVHTLGQMAKNKIAAALERRDIRDFFDLEFLLRKGAIFAATKA
jgi:predicted nucleotidyltransferase component of viral defense system